MTKSPLFSPYLKSTSGIPVYSRLSLLLVTVKDDVQMVTALRRVSMLFSGQLVLYRSPFLLLRLYRGQYYDSIWRSSLSRKRLLHPQVR
jgi:hypothetical protein